MHAGLVAAHAVFSLLHVVSAYRVVSWAHARWELGLSGFGWPWEEGEKTWLLAGQLQSNAQPNGNAWTGALLPSATPRGDAASHTSETDVPPEALADPDSCFMECMGVNVHYKMAIPTRGSIAEDGGTAVMLIHSFGGGVFAWRHTMQPLADACGMQVLAFDRPGFGELCGTAGGAVLLPHMPLARLPAGPSKHPQCDCA